MKLYCLLIFYLLASSTALAGVLTDTTYIKKYSQKIQVAGYVADNSIDIEKHGTLYTPNNSLNLGLGLTIKNTIINFEYDFGIVPLKSKEFGKTKIFDFQVHNYGEYFVLDITAQSYKGFYYQKNNNAQPVLFPGLSVLQTGIEYTYIFNGDKFSARAAFDQSELQLRSAGSFVLGGGTYFYRLGDKNQAISADNSDVRNYQIGFNAGYGYTKVLGTKWMLTGMVTAGSNFGNQPELLGDGKIKVYPTAFARASTTYHKADWAVSLAMLLHDTSVSNLQNENISLVSLDFQMTYVRHLDRIFKKR